MTTQVIDAAPTSALAVAIRETGISEQQGKDLLEAFQPFFNQAMTLVKEAEAINVTDEDILDPGTHVGVSAGRSRNRDKLIDGAARNIVAQGAEAPLAFADRVLGEPLECHILTKYDEAVVRQPHAGAQNLCRRAVLAEDPQIIRSGAGWFDCLKLE